MGCDIHGVWECRLPNGDWVAFKRIDDTRSYEWFGILSGVRRDGPRCDAIEWDPRREQADYVGSYWLDICNLWGPDLHSHTLVSIPALRQANRAYIKAMKENEDYEEHEEVDEHETVPSLDDVVEKILVGFGGFDESGNGRDRAITMGIPLRDVMMLGPDATIDDPNVISRIRMVVAYDN